MIAPFLFSCRLSQTGRLRLPNACYARARPHFLCAAAASLVAPRSPSSCGPPLSSSAPAVSLCPGCRALAQKLDAAHDGHAVPLSNPRVDIVSVLAAGSVPLTAPAGGENNASSASDQHGGRARATVVSGPLLQLRAAAENPPNFAERMPVLACSCHESQASAYLSVRMTATPLFTPSAREGPAPQRAALPR